MSAFDEVRLGREVYVTGPPDTWDVIFLLAKVSFSVCSKLHAWVIGQAKFLEDETSLTPCEEMTESTIYDIQQQVNKTKKRVKTLVRTMELQNRLLVMMARKMNLGVEADELDTGDWVPEAQPGTAYGLLLGDDDKSEDEKEESKRQMARL